MSDEENVETPVLPEIRIYNSGLREEKRRKNRKKYNALLAKNAGANTAITQV